MMQESYSNNFITKPREELIKIEVGLKNMPARMSSSALAKIPDNLRNAAFKVVDLFLQVSVNIYFASFEWK